ncbi:DUF4132 domain-containing protein [Novosphingobium rosa]|uniref:DUF4132 domain-containing protein n=1 Tax=Novosphingobium rosa TaxID=76978 RepID=UPI00082E0C1E|nr:DUF4132 domain-containing protein [Novosphingobium rosa]
MTGGLWDRFRQTLGLGGRDEDDAQGLPVKKLFAFFQSLAEQDRMLPAQIAHYVTRGDNPSLLLQVQTPAVRQAWQGKHHQYTIKDEHGLLADLSPWEAGALRRLGEVLAALQPIPSPWSFFGTKNGPDWLRLTVTLWMLDRERKDQPLTLLLALVSDQPDGTAQALDILFNRDPGRGGDNSLHRFSGVTDWLAQAHDSIVAALPGVSADSRSALLVAIGRLGLHQPYLALLIDSASGTSKKLRVTARQALTGADRDQLTAGLNQAFAAAAPSRRAELVDVAVTVLGEAAPPLLASWRQQDASPKLAAALDRLDASLAAGVAQGGEPDGAQGYLAVDGSRIEVGPRAPLPVATPVPEALLKRLEPALAEFNRMLDQSKAEPDAVKKWHWSRHETRRDARDLKALAALAEGDEPVTEASRKSLNWMHQIQHASPAVGQFLNDPELTLYHLTRMAVVMSGGRYVQLFNEWSGPFCAALRQRLEQGADIRVVLGLWQQAGGTVILSDHLASRWSLSLKEQDSGLLATLCESFGALDEALGLVPQSGARQTDMGTVFALLGLFPVLPERYRNRLMLLAGDSSKHLREPARALLRQTPGLGRAIALQLQDGKQDVRALAAEWLAARGEAGQVPALRAALAKERSDLGRAAMITALERLGEDVSDCFDPEAMLKEARAGLARPRPKGLEWFPFDQLPALSWADGTALDPLLPTWWVVLATKLKQPGGNALMSLWLDRLAPGDAQKLGWMILTGWIEKDTRTPSDDEANAYAAAHVDATLANNITYAKRYPQSADYWPTDRDVVFQQLRRAKAGTYLDTAAESKGMLALASRVNGADAAQRVRAFLKDHGGRTSQAKALLEVLATNGSSAALQAVLAAANRSKQRSVQAHAAQLIEQIAERNGWSAAQLADRTIPTGGFEADGTQDVDCGEGRAYRLQLDAQDNVVILNGEGREVKALPGVRVEDEKPLIDAAKKQLTTARKEVKQVLAAQGERLQESMYLERIWDLAEWESFVAGHPIVGRIAARLVWQGLDGAGAPVATFRPLGDGSYSDAGDDEVEIGAFAQIRLAHSSLLGAGEIAGWRTHLADYAVAAPFDQLGRDLPVLTQGQGRQRSIADREGWMIETFKLRGAATKLGYQRGQAQDGGWFLTYEKTYRDAGLVAEIEFSGSPLPEENRASALQGLSFRKLRMNGGGGGLVVLDDVPPVLLAESWRDLHDIAEKGTGFDPEWNKKVY